jgi:hypothetical protein
VITLETDYAGELSIKQILVTRITTDHAVAVRFADGTGLIGTISALSADKVRVTGANSSVDLPVGNIAATWSAGEDDPDVVALRRKWSYEANADIGGENGTQRQFSTALGYRAKLVGPLDTFQYYANYARQETNSQVSADQFKAGVDYSDLFTATTSWYVRDEAGFDRVNDITFYDVAASGLGYDFIKVKDEALTGRAGLSYRYDEYTEPTRRAQLARRGLRAGVHAQGQELAVHGQDHLRPRVPGPRQLHRDPRGRVHGADRQVALEAEHGRHEQLQQPARLRRRQAGHALLHPPRPLVGRGTK